MSVVSVKNISKVFKVYHDRNTSLKERILFKNRNSYEERTVLKDISFEVEKGEAVGIIGHNGCGKSTLLKILTKIMYPNSGSLKINGRISSLIELGAGFHPDMSGRENIYTNASIFGLTRKEIDNRVQTIIDFSELEEFIDNPIRTYSSGMYMRLAFSVAIHVDANVLLIDEILGVGDASFQAKCFNKMCEIKASGVTIIIVSHSLGQIEQICERSIWIDGGLIRKQGSPFDIHPEYMEFMGQKTQPISIKKAKDEDEKNESDEQEPEKEKKRWGSKDVEITTVKLYGESDIEKSTFKTGEPMKIEISYKVNTPVKKPVVGIGIFRNDGLNCYGTNTLIDRIAIPAMDKDGVVECKIHKNNLLTGDYSLDVAIHADDSFAYDYYRGAKQFKMYSAVSDGGVCRLNHEWLAL